MVFHWSLSVSKSPQISSQYFGRSKQWCCLDGLYTSSNFHLFRPLSKPFRTIPSAQITIGITITLMFHSFLSSQASSKFLFSLSLIFHSVVRWDSKVHNTVISLFSKLSLGLNFLLVLGDLFIPQNPRGYYYYYYHYYYYCYSLRVFHISVGWWFSTEIDWQQVSSKLQDSSQYSRWS